MMYNYPNYNPDEYMMTGVNITNYQQSPFTPSYSPRIANSYDGFIRGNMFPDLYEPYTPNEPYNLTPQNEREDLLNKVRECNFAAIDLGLYLDTHPDDAEKIKAFNQCMEKGKQLTAEYEQKYGPLSLSSETLDTYPWAWLMTPWPWEVK